MSFRLDLANRSELFKVYASWFEDDNLLDDSHNNIAFRISSIILSFEKIHILTNECIHQFELFEKSSNINKKSENINFQGPSVYEIFVNISNILTSLRIIQNSILNIVSNEERKNKNNIQFQSSMHSFMNELDKKPKKYAKLDPKIIHLLENYWKNNGLMLKHYRDIDEHHNFLIKKVYINNFKDKKLILLFPDNPYDNSSKKFTFNQQINAMNFLLNEFFAIENLLNQLANHYKYKEGSFDFTFKIEDENPNRIAILFDPNNMLIHLESYIRDNKIYHSRNFHEIDISQYSFTKIPSFFKNSKTFRKNDEMLKQGQNHFLIKEV